MSKNEDVLTDDDFLSDADFDVQEAPSSGPLEEPPPQPVDVAQEEATGYNMDKFLSDTGDVLGRVASIPGDIYEAGKFAWNQAPEELEKIKQDPAGALKAAALAPAVSQNLNALVEKGIAKLDPTLSSEAYQDLYGNRDITDIAEQNRASQEESMKDFPLTSMASKMATTTALAAPAIAAAPAALAVAAPTVAYGTLGGIEAGEKKLNETGSLEEGLREGVKSLATQGLADAATFGLAKAAKSGLQSLKKVPASQTLKSIGATSDEIAALEKASTFRPDKSPEAIAKQLEESGVVRALRSKESAATKLADAITSESTKLDDVVKSASSKVNPEFMGTMVDDIAKTAEDQILKKLAVESGISDPDHPIVKDIQRKLQELKNVGEENILTGRKNPTFEQIHNKKKEFGEAVRSWEPGRTNAHQQALRDLYGIVNEGLDMMAQSTDIGDAYKSQNSKLAKLFAAKKLADPKGDPSLLAGGQATLGGLATRSLRKYGPVGAATAAVAGTLGLPATAAALPVAYGAAKYGRSTVAAGARGIEKTLNFGAQNASKALESAKMRFPEVYNKFASVIENAAKRGDAAVSATNYMLSQQFPEYREMIENSKDTEGLPVELTDEEFE